MFARTRRLLPLLLLSAIARADPPALPLDFTPDVAPAPIIGAPPAPPPFLTMPRPDPQALAFMAFVYGLRGEAIAAGVKPETFDRETIGLTFNPRVIRADRGQPGGPVSGTPSASLNFAPYARSHVDAAHIAGGRRRYEPLHAQLGPIEAKTGVPEAITLAIYGEETGYGAVTGNYDLLRSFASLAFDGRRRALFVAEFIATLKLIDRGFPRSMMRGSWAGATGFPQFLPSVYLRLGTDGDGDGRADIWTSEADALASIGHYLSDAGWKPNVPWGVPVSVPAGFDRSGLTSSLNSPRCPRVHARLSRWLTVGEWKARGIAVPAMPVLADNELTTLIEPDGQGATAYLATINYQVILDYNCSNFYALAIGTLADAIVK